MTLTPAYGRDYKSKAALLADFDSDKEFVAQDHRSQGYTNKAQLMQLGVTEVTMRYGKLRKVFVHRFIA